MKLELNRQVYHLKMIDPIQKVALNDLKWIQLVVSKSFCVK